MSKLSPLNEDIENLHLRIKELENREEELLKVLRIHEALHLGILNALPINIFLEDREGRTIFANDTTCDMNGKSLEELIGKTVFDFFPKKIAENQRAMDLEVWKQRNLITKEVKVNFSGEEKHMLTGKTIIHLKESNNDYMLGFGLDITDRIIAERLIKHMAYHDTLTDLPNRRFVETFLADYTKHNNINKQNMLGIVLLDLDRFKVINDSLGHHAGDMLLQAVSNRLINSVGEKEITARIGGDEFIILIPNMQHRDEAMYVCEKIMRSMEDDFEIYGQKLNVTTSIGISLYPKHGNDLNTLVKGADLAMYQSKDKGRNCYTLFSSTMRDCAIERMDKEILLRQALETNEFVLFYQPKIEIATNKIYGMEALIRWRNDDQIISPDSFIPLAEETGLIITIGEWVLRQACTDCKSWHDQGLSHLSVSVNISPQQFKRQNIEELVSSILQETGLPPSALELELTEGIIMQDPGNASFIISNLKALGIKISIDDFGTGFSSLGYLKQFPIDILKIDKSFVTNLEWDETNASISTAVISLAHSLKLEVVAEGIENEEQLTFFRNHGCDFGQGYLISKPVEMDMVMNLIKEKYIKVN
ncbi:EAL domain-containing protein [Neobacillus sp. PS3-12]|uniref:putative bifunctional diguanylate cyclase/phosphodiesterase n=1 Tax=Neobacillus sp. PS3-12 TaxID=3070677 RepID=UPI0027E0D14D|nr:EAL domain-containing protein [Neobacillus sp. PS3-12]WML51370.1 EAL domain-containing protein [Neobacillus sp. PS3-12]